MSSRANLDSTLGNWPHLTAGGKENSPIIFLHGFLGCREDWLECAQVLSDSHYLVMPDLPGCGKNTHRTLEERLDFDLISTELAAFVKKHDLGEYNLLGYSMGGRIALHATLHNFVTPKALIIESGSAGIEDKNERSKRVSVDTQRAQDIEAGGLEKFLRSWYQAELFGNIASRPEEFQPLLKLRLDSNSEQWAAKVIRDLSPGSMPSLWKELHKLQVPTLVIAGERDSAYQKVCQRIAELVPNGRFKSIENAAHSPHRENVAQYTQVLLEFLSEHSSSR